MSHFDRRVAEIELSRMKRGVRQPRAYKRKPRRITIGLSDADVLMFIASRLNSAGLHNFAAELERIATDSSPAQGLES